ncbi:unnamed protein product [Rotaria socialis]
MGAFIFSSSLIQHTHTLIFEAVRANISGFLFSFTKANSVEYLIRVNIELYNKSIDKYDNLRRDTETIGRLILISFEIV